VSNDELDTIRNAMVEREGLIASIFSLLRNAPRYVPACFNVQTALMFPRSRLVMILKLNDLQRALDISLATTHGAVSPRTPTFRTKLIPRSPESSSSLLGSAPTQCTKTTSAFCGNVVPGKASRRIGSWITSGSGTTSTGSTRTSTQPFLGNRVSLTSCYSGLRFVEWGMDARAEAVKVLLWLKGLRERGWNGAFEVSAGLLP
jgi:aarF domain-containing kinase